MGHLNNAGGAGGPIVPELAAAAAGAGAPAPGAAGQPQAPPDGVPPEIASGQPSGPPSGQPPEMPGAGQPQAAPGGMPPSGVQQVDPTAAAVSGQLPPGMQEQQASPEEQQEYERAMRALSQVLYSNDEIANSIVDQVDPNDKVGTTSKVSILLMNQLDQKVNMDESVVATVSQELVERISELAEARHNIEYGERELQVIMGAVWEGVQAMFGMDEQQAQALMSGIGGDGLADLKGQYEGFLNG